MRIVVILLLLANLALFALTRLDSVGGGEPQRMQEQVQPDKVKLLTPQQVAALGPAKVASLADVCVEWGPLTDAERTRALAELAPLQLGPLIQSRRASVENFAVTLPGFISRSTAERRIGELRARGINDLAVIELDRGQFGVSLGTFRTEQAANGRADALAQQGVTGTRVAARGAMTQTTLVFRDPPQPAMAKLRELVPTYAGTEMRVGDCARAAS